MVEERELESLLDNALQDFEPEPTIDHDNADITTDKNIENDSYENKKLPNVHSSDYTSVLDLEGNHADDEAYLDELTKEFDKTFSRFLEATPDLQSNFSDSHADDLPNLEDDDLQNNIIKTMENLLKEADNTAGGRTEDSPDAMLPMLEQLFGKLLSKDVLHEPLQELCNLFPAWLEDNQGNPKLKLYNQQYKIVSDICAIFNSDSHQEESGKIYQLLCDMQDTGPPPPDIITKMSQEIPGQLVPGNPVTPGNPDQCSIQ